MEIEISDLSDPSLFIPEKEKKFLYFSETDFVCSIFINLNGENHVFKQEPVLYFLRSLILTMMNAIVFRNDDQLFFHTYDAGLSFYGQNSDSSSSQVNGSLRIGLSQSIFSIEIDDLRSMASAQVDKLVQHLLPVYSSKSIFDVIWHQLIPSYNVHDFSKNDWTRFKKAP
jgi:hypothetical protein